MNNRWLLGIILGILLAILLGFARQTKSPSLPTNHEKTIVVASFYPVYFWAHEIAEDKAAVTNLTPAGSEPHDYEPTAQDIAIIEKSKLLILNGGGLEVWADKIKENLKGKNTITIRAGEDLVTRKDPHVWLAPQLAKKQVEKIFEGYKKADPANSTLYQQNALRLQNKLDMLDQKYKQELSTCQQKDVVTSHAAFGYLAQTYGLNQIAISGLSPDEEPPPAKLVEIAKFAKEKNIKYIFFERLVSPKLSQTIASEIGAKTLVLNPIEGLTPQDVEAGKNYFSLMEDNLTNLKLALLCQ